MELPTEIKRMSAAVKPGMVLRSTVAIVVRKLPSEMGSMRRRALVLVTLRAS